MDGKMFFIWVGIGVATHCIRTAYEILKFKKIIIPDKISFIIILSVMLLMWISWFNMCTADIYKIIIPDLVRFFGLVVFIAGIIIFLTALFTIKAVETHKGDLVTGGVYSKIRHPMYLSFILWLIGLSVFSGAVISFIVSIAFITNILFWKYLEEKELEIRYPTYNDYKKRTIF